MNIDYILRVNELDIFYTTETNGGGDHFLTEYANVVSEWYGEVDNLLEWCAGPGFIGYGMLGAGICKHVSFNEIFLPAVDMCKKTASVNNLNVNVYTDDTLDDVQEQFDLVVGNPPHWSTDEYARASMQAIGGNLTIEDRMKQVLVDENWKAHKSFFKNMKRLLKQDGRILLQENATGSSPQMFSEMLAGTGLKVLSSAESIAYRSLNIYYLEIGHE